MLCKKKMLTREEIETIIKLKQVKNKTWKFIASAIKSKPETVRSAYKRALKKRAAPPSAPPPSKSKVTPELGIYIKQLLQNDPALTYAQLADMVQSKCQDSSIAPKQPSIRRFCIKNNIFKM